jgi:AcrR family transcriptional regulator
MLGSVETGKLGAMARSETSAGTKALLTTRELILASAERLFAEHGYDGVSMPRIAAASGITAGAIYRHFDSKEELFFEVVRTAFHAVAVSADPQSGGSSSVSRTIADYTSQRFRRQRLLAVEIHYASGKHPKVRRWLRQAVARDIEDVVKAIESEQAVGRIDAAVDPVLVASSIIVFVMGLMHMETLLPERIGDDAWRAFVESQVAALLSAKAE